MDLSKELEELSTAFKVKVPELEPMWAQCAAWMKVLTTDYETLRKENSTLRYALADSRNTIKDMQSRQKKDLEIGIEEVIRRNMLDLMPILDALDAGTKHDEGGEAFCMINDMLVNTLAARGLKRIDTSGDYDMLRHECVKRGEGMKITKEVRAGYTLNDKVLRPAQVEVG